MFEIVVCVDKFCKNVIIFSLEEDFDGFGYF